MKANIIKRVLTGALVLSLVMAPCIGAYAVSDNDIGPITSGNSAGSGCGSSISSNTARTVKKSSSSVAAVKAIPTTSKVAGVESSVSGVYMVEKVNGAAITTDLATISADYGLADGERLFARMMDMDSKKSNLARACIDAAAAAYNAEVGPCLNIELGKMSAGKYSVLPAEGGVIRISVGIPADFADAEKTLDIVRVREGGVIDILKDVDTDPNTITFDTTAGAGAYAIIKY